MTAQPPDDGGAAFPVPPVLHETGPDSYWSQHPHPGMTLRDYFAGQAMAGMLANDTLMVDMQHTLQADGQDSKGQRDMTCRIVARRAYLHADAMLLARRPAPEKGERT